MLDGDESSLSAEVVSGLGPGSSGGNDGLGTLSCVTCRSRKLKCDRTLPACARCTKLKAECVYPESRRKPTFKRRNVKELEERLAQVEVLLKDAAGRTSLTGTSGQNGSPQDQGPQFPQDNRQDASQPDSTFHTSAENPFEAAPDDALNWSFPTGLPSAGVNGITPDGDRPPLAPAAWGNIYSYPGGSGGGHKPRPEGAGATGFELLGLGMYEALPPAEMIEELHQRYFTLQHPLIPVVHPGRYIQAFYSAPHLRPPMALQYAIWTMATNGHEKYSGYHDAFHRRCRHYLQEDELSALRTDRDGTRATASTF